MGTITSTKSGDWGTVGTWVGGTAPVAHSGTFGWAIKYETA